MAGTIQSVMSVCMALRQMFAISRLPSFWSCASSLQFSRRTLCFSNHNSLTNCCTRATKAVSVLWPKQQNLYIVLKSDASWQRITWQCGFHTTPQRNIPPVLWMVIKPLVRVASMLTGRSVHLFYYMAVNNVKKII